MPHYPGFPQRFKSIVSGEKELLPQRVNLERGKRWNILLRKESPSGLTLRISKTMLRLKELFLKEKNPSPKVIETYSKRYFELAARSADQIVYAFEKIEQKADWNELFASFLHARRFLIPAPVRAHMRKEIFANLRKYYPKGSRTKVGVAQINEALK